MLTDHESIRALAREFGIRYDFDKFSVTLPNPVTLFVFDAEGTMRGVLSRNGHVEFTQAQIDAYHRGLEAERSGKLS